jgi:hypothetical protein
MSGIPERTVSGPEKIVFDEAVDTLSVRIVGGAVNVVGIEEGPARMEVTELEGPPLKVGLSGSTLTVTYEDLTWKGLLKWRERSGWKRHAVISLAVPQHTRVEVGVIGAEAVVSGITGPTSVQGVNGDTTLVGLTGTVRANTVAGNVEAQSLSGDLRINTVSGDLTVVEGSGSEVRADSVSGNMVLDLDPSAGADVRLTTVSGEIAIRIPEPGDAEVDASTTSGHVSCAFEELHVTGWGSGEWAAKKITGRIGSGAARLRATTVSGAIALLRRPPLEDLEDLEDTADPAAEGPRSPSFRKEG